jgi:hypothetical protein
MPTRMCAAREGRGRLPHAASIPAHLSRLAARATRPTRTPSRAVRSTDQGTASRRLRPHLLPRRAALTHALQGNTSRTATRLRAASSRVTSSCAPAARAYREVRAAPHALRPRCAPVPYALKARRALASARRPRARVLLRRCASAPSAPRTGPAPRAIAVPRRRPPRRAQFARRVGKSRKVSLYFAATPPAAPSSASRREFRLLPLPCPSLSPLRQAQDKAAEVTPSNRVRADTRPPN